VHFIILGSAQITVCVEILILLTSKTSTRKIRMQPKAQRKRKNNAYIEQFDTVDVDVIKKKGKNKRFYFCLNIVFLFLFVGFCSIYLLSLSLRLLCSLSLTNLYIIMIITALHIQLSKYAYVRGCVLCVFVLYIKQF